MKVTKAKYVRGEYCASHSDPVWRTKSDFIILAFLETKDGHNHWEQLWAKRVEGNHFFLCCIPFFTYGLNLGDEVVCDTNNQITDIAKPSGNVTYRVWLEAAHDKSVNDELLLKLSELKAEYEWSSENLLAVSVRLENCTPLEQYLSDHANSGLLFESGNS